MPIQQKPPILLTGTTGGLGAKVLSFLLIKHSLPPSSIIATSRSESNRQRYESQGLQFRAADFKDISALKSAFQNVENVLFVSSPERDTALRNAEHANVVEAAKAAGVGKVWYVSLAFGGYGDESKVGFQQAHYETEKLLVDSGLNFVSLRAGIYTDAFPLYLNWYPSSTEVLLPELEPTVAKGEIAFTSRDDLAEGIAALLAKGLEAYPSIVPKTEKNIVLLTAASNVSLIDVVDAIDGVRGTATPVKYLPPKKWIEDSAEDDVGCKGLAWFEARLVVLQGFVDGDAALVDHTLEKLLGRKPETGVQAVKRLLKENAEFTWHQNHAR
ncbi:nmrA-like family protein [Zymoseptoria brevis]|uniref:NmrA-like family protein n=1 Tax=Zymoseptoria brevis TaxID=1047168 RepID=A0A0F4GTJ7_9PEZI|nr:nmrA-like family protein [Zymoseptoria brevis]